MALEASRLLTPEQVQRLRAKSDLVGALLVLHAWGLIFASMALFVAWPNPLTFVVAVMVIGARQLGLAILMHDAAHGLLFDSRRLNEWVGAPGCARRRSSPACTLYRPYHLKHHRHTQQAGGSRSRPVGAVPDQPQEPVAQDRPRPHRPHRLPAPARAVPPRPGQGVAGPSSPIWCCSAGLSAIGYWWLYPLLWLLPLATWYQLVSRIRNIAEHAVVPDNDDPLRNTRTTLANVFERLFVAPYWVNYHLEHHLFMFVPCWRLPAAHRALLASGLRERMEIQPGYAAVLRLATSRAERRPRAAPQQPCGARPAHLRPGLAR